MDYNPKEVTKRILEYAVHENVSDADLALMMGMNRSQIQKLRKDKAIIIEARVIMFLNLNREVSTDWVLFGEGEMFGSPGEYKAEFGADGSMKFETDTAAGNRMVDENKTLKAIVAEKEEANRVLAGMVESLNAHVAKQDAHISMLIEKM